MSMVWQLRAKVPEVYLVPSFLLKIAFGLTKTKQLKHIPRNRFFEGFTHFKIVYML